MLRTLRRVKQLTYLLVSPEFRSPGRLGGHSLRRYDSEAEVTHYRATAADGLRYEEAGALRDFLVAQGPTRQAARARALVVGAGCGREAFALAQHGLEVTGIDQSPAMIAAARELSEAVPAVDGATQARVTFNVSTLERFAAPGRFELVFVSTAIAEHIYSSAGRRAFYERARELVARHGRIFVFPAIQKLEPRSAYFWASQILRVRWAAAGLDWEQGDSARAFYGKHNRDFRPVFYHFYPDREAFEREIAQAGLEVALHFEGAFLLRPVNE